MYVGTAYHRMADVVSDMDIVIELPDIKYLYNGIEKLVELY